MREKAKSYCLLLSIGEDERAALREIIEFNLSSAPLYEYEYQALLSVLAKLNQGGCRV